MCPHELSCSSTHVDVRAIVDSSQVETLWNIAGTGTPSAIKAQNVLRLVLDTSFAELIEEIDTSLGGSKRSRMENTQKEQEAEWVKPTIGNLYPNPSDNGFIIEYNLTEEMDNVYLEVFDLLGNRFIDQKLINSRSRAEIKTNNLSSKIYLCRVRSVKETLSTQKLVIIK